MKTDKLLMELENLVEQAGYTIRRERGTFRGDHCVMEGDKLVVVNKNKPPQEQVGLMARVLQDRDLQDTYIKPAVRKELEELWDRFDTFAESEIEELDIELDG
ncbi:MAG: hypothetical protein U5K31_08230 [Balneolaceae bacterium]|nr:hypothetical protein [Balneolaceae bacterium]